MSWVDQLSHLKVVNSSVDFSYIDEKNRVSESLPVEDPEVSFRRNEKNLVDSALDESIERMRGLALHDENTNSSVVDSVKEGPTPSTSRGDKENTSNVSKHGSLRLSDLKKRKLRIIRKAK